MELWSTYACDAFGKHSTGWLYILLLPKRWKNSYGNFFIFLETQLCGQVQMEQVYSTAYHSYQSWSVLEVIWNNYFRPQILNKT